MNSIKAVDILQVTLESATVESVKTGGATVLGALLDASIANPAAAVIASVAKALVQAVFHTTSSIERKVDVVLTEPLSTAVTTLSDVLSVEATTPEEQEECERLLTRSADDLAKAYTYAEKSHPTRCLIIREYQALIAALRQGGRPFVDLFMRELLDVARATRKESAIAREEAEAIRRRDADTVEALRQSWYEAVSFADMRPSIANEAGFKEMLIQRELQQFSRAAEMDRKAKAQESFCAFVEILAAHRVKVLMVSKITQPNQFSEPEREI